MTTVRKVIRSEAAAKRVAERAKLTLEEQLAVCDTRPGNSARERARITAAIATRDGTSVRKGKSKQTATIL